jgi:hypothetical protein
MGFRLTPIHGVAASWATLHVGELNMVGVVVQMLRGKGCAFLSSELEYLNKLSVTVTMTVTASHPCSHSRGIALSQHQWSVLRACVLMCTGTPAFKGKL